MKSIHDQKALLRKEIIEKLNKLDPETTKSSNEAIIKQVINLPKYKCAKTVFAFIGVGWEIDTKDLLKHALSSGKKLSVPLCVGKESMEARYIHSLADLTVGVKGIPEPLKSCPVCLPEEIDFALIPCISCDRTCMRLGQGGGYYDRYLINTSFPNAAICRNIALVEAIPTDPWDCHVECVITETDIYYWKNEKKP